ncbi:MAG: glycosyltransferase family protein [Anaerolineaceae bacterium]|nr:glycosyltransferase family protein [Anaerolineaceae bacterium]
MDRPRDPGVVAIIQARMGSSRLPGKVLKEIGGVPMLARVVVRARRARSLGRVVVATTTDPGDDLLAAYCRKQGFPVFRGDPYDVLDRYYQAARRFDAEIIVRLTADCPVIDPREIDRTVSAFLDAKVDFAANRLPPPWHRTTPIGMDTEVVTFQALARAWREAEAKYEREHVMPYFYEEAGRFNILLVDHDPDLGDLRLTVDTPEDLELVRKVFDRFGNTDEFTMAEMVALLESHPELRQLNAAVTHKTYRDVDDRA